MNKKKYTCIYILLILLNVQWFQHYLLFYLIKIIISLQLVEPIYKAVKALTKVHTECT
jgi:hypothetical protein